MSWAGVGRISNPSHMGVSPFCLAMKIAHLPTACYIFGPTPPLPIVSFQPLLLPTSVRKLPI